MKIPALAAACLLLAVSTGFPDQLYYRSNSVGMLLERIPPYRRDESPWVMGVNRSGATEVRTLLENGKEVRRWEVATEGAQAVERELASGVLSARRVYESSGQLIQEEQYQDGALKQKTIYSYTNRRLVRARTLDAAGTTLYADEYLYATNGSLRAVRRTGSTGAQRSSVVAGGGGIFEERTDSGDTLLVARYDSTGRTTSLEKRRGGVTIDREDFVYQAGLDALASSTERIPADGSVIQRRYDDAGRLSLETTTRSSGTPMVTSWVRDDKGRVLSRSTRGSSGLETWTYTLADDGSVSREEYSRRGTVEKVTIYGAKQRTEEFYKEGKVFLRAFFEGDVRVKEEVWSDGALVRTRTWP